MVLGAGLLACSRAPGAPAGGTQGSSPGSVAASGGPAQAAAAAGSSATGSAGDAAGMPVVPQGGPPLPAADAGPAASPSVPAVPCPFAPAAPPASASCDARDQGSDPALSVHLHLDQLGFERALPKHAVVEADGVLSRFQLLDQSDQPVYCGDLQRVDFSEWGGGPYYYTLALDGWNHPGSYRLQVNGTRSEPFSIEDNLLFQRTLAQVLSYLRSARADDPDVWSADQNVPFEGSSETHDVRGGWYDASGDISKYLSHLSYANFMNPQQIPLVVWALAWLHDERGALLQASMAAEVESEALWGADYLHRVLDPAGYFYIDVFDGWSGDVTARSICAFEGEAGTRTRDFQAAFREGGGMAIAALARVARWGKPGTFGAAQYLADAERGFAHLQQHGPEYCDDGVENVIDDYTALLAASELYAATAGQAYLAAARARAAALAARLDPSGYFIADGGARPFWHASDAGLPVVALARYAALEPDAGRRQPALSAISAHLQYLLAVTSEVANPFGYARQHVSTGGGVRSSFFIPHDNETGYWWQGENARLGSLAAAAAIGGTALCPDAQHPGALPPALAGFAIDQLDWILGKNPYDVGFIAGIGRSNPPPYSGDKPQQGHQNGGISNGITGRNDDGSGIQWRSDDSADPWTDWRWVEQWLPHAAWYLVAVGALSRPAAP